VKRARFGVAEHPEAEHERQGRGVPELEQRPRDRDADDDPPGQAGRLASPGIGFGDELLEIDARCGRFRFHDASPRAHSNKGRGASAAALMGIS
jgi:hypothetical protein